MNTNSTMKSALFALLAAAALASAADAQSYKPSVYIPPQKQTVTAYMLLLEGNAGGGGFEVTRVLNGSPTLSMKRVGNGRMGGLEAGDVITHVNGKKICCEKCLRDALNASGGCPVVLTVKDCNSGCSARWQVKPVRVTLEMSDE